MKDVAKFGPSPRSVISVHDFESPESLAHYLLYLLSNRTAYEEFLEWKRVGYSRDFKALIDLSAVHSECRICIRVADLLRRELGDPPSPHALADRAARPAQYVLALRVRERGRFWFRTVYLQVRLCSDRCPP